MTYLVNAPLNVSVYACHLFGGGRHAHLDYNDSPGDVFFLHALAIHLYGLDAHLWFL